MRRLIWLSLLCIALTSSAWPQNDERILDYHSNITVNQDGSMDVRETIQVRARGQQIKRGIYRDFPTSYTDRFEKLVRVDFQVLEVLRDGQPDGSRIADQGNGVRVYIGKPDVLLPPGEYTYTLAYRTTRQISFFEDHDELYWNVTGNGWIFPIDQASATVTLPKGVSRSGIRLEGYTGPQGAKNQDFTSNVASDSKSSFQTARMLPPQAGLTIVVSFPKGVVNGPTLGAKFGDFLAENRPELVGGLGLFVLLGYYLVVWWQVGRDPEGGAIMPLYEPPRNFSPAGIRYLAHMGFDDKTFAAAVLNMAVKGHLAIREDAGTYTISQKAEGSAGLTPDESVVSSKLFVLSKSLALKTTNQAVIYTALQALEESLKKSQQKVYFYSNSLYLIPGVLLTLAALFAILVAMNLEEAPIAVVMFLSLPFTAVTMAACFLLRKALPMWKQVFSGGFTAGLVANIFKSLGALPFLLVGLGVLGAVATPTAAGLLAAMMGCNILFYFLLDRPTLFGRRMLDQIEGFKMFLSAVEGDRLRMQGAVDKTPELFEKYLPYALALDVEHQWAEQFSEVFARAVATETSRDRDRHYSPSWYSSSDPKRLSSGNFAESFGRSFSQAVASSSTPPGRSGSGSSMGRSSGSGGGGSSGGGGGGGGGGGW